MEKYKEYHKDEYKADPLVTVKVPGVSTVLGEFSYYCKGYTLCCANSQSLDVSISFNDDNIVRVLNTFTNDRKKFSISSLKYRKEDKWCNFVKAVFYMLADKGLPVRGLNISLSGTVLRSDNATLSAALSVGTVVAMNEIGSYGLSLDEMAMVCYQGCTGYCGELTKFSTIIAMMKAQSGKYMLFDLSKMDFSYLCDPFLESDASNLVVNCNIPPTAIREEVSHKHKQVRKAFDILKEKSNRCSFKEVQRSDLVDRIVQVGEEARKICCAVLEDCRESSELEKLFEAKDYARIGKVCSKVGDLVRDDLELTCPEIDWVIKRSSEISGCYGAFPVFNGDGAYVAVVIDNSSVDRFNSKLEDYERIFGFRPITKPFSPCGCFQLVKHI